MFKPNHLHVLIKGTINYPPKSTEVINNWFTRLVKKVGMEVVAGPTSVYINDLGNEGLTGTVTLATSHSSIHIWDRDEPPMFQFDLYSCCYFCVEDVIAHLNEFQLLNYSYTLIDRNADMVKIIDQRTQVKCEI